MTNGLLKTGSRVEFRGMMICMGHALEECRKESRWPNALMLDLTQRSKCQYGTSHAIFYHMVSSLRVWWSHALKTIIHWWIKCANYFARLGGDIQKMLHFLMAKSGRCSAKLAYKRRFKSYDKWSLAFVLLCCWIYWGCWGKPIGCSASILKMLGRHLGLFPHFQ